MSITTLSADGAVGEISIDSKANIINAYRRSVALTVTIPISIQDHAQFEREMSIERPQDQATHADGPQMMSPRFASHRRVCDQIPGCWLGAQSARLFVAFREWGTISPEEGPQLNCADVAAAIRMLRRRGHHIRTVWQTVRRGGLKKNVVARYVWYGFGEVK